MIARRLAGPHASTVTIYTPTMGELDEHGDPDTTPTEQTAQAVIYPETPSETGDLTNNRYQAFFDADAVLAPSSWVMDGAARYDLVGDVKRWPTSGVCEYQETVMARTA
jgi:hypothetical protein